MNNMNVTYDDNGTEMIPVPEWMKSHQYYNEMSNGGRHAYPLHTGAVGIPGLCKGCRIVSLKVPPLFHPEYDIGTEYGLLDWIDDIQDWCIMCEVDCYKQGKMVALAVDGFSKMINKYVNNHHLVYGQVQDWGDGDGPLHRTGVEIVLRILLGLYPPNPQAIQLNAIKQWDNFRRKPHETTQGMLARLKLAMFKATTDGQYPITQIMIARRLVELFELGPDDYTKYMRPFGGNLPTTPAQVELLESELSRDFTLKESMKPGAVVTPLTVIKGQAQNFHGVVAAAPAVPPIPQQAPLAIKDGIPPALTLAPAFPIHWAQANAMTAPAAMAPTPMPLAGGPYGSAGTLDAVQASVAAAYPAGIPPPPAPLPSDRGIFARPGRR